MTGEYGKITREEVMKAIDAWVIEQIKLLTDPETGGDFDRLYDVCQTFQIDNGHDAIIAAIDEVAKVLLGMKDDCLPALKRVILKQKEAAEAREAGKLKQQTGQVTEAELILVLRKALERAIQVGRSPHGTESRLVELAKLEKVANNLVSSIHRFELDRIEASL